MSKLDENRGRQASLLASVVFAAATWAACSHETTPGPTVEVPPSSAKACPDDAAFFETRIFRRFVGTQCIDCHVDGGLAETSGLVFTASNEPGAEEKNLAALRSIALVDEGGEPLLLRKPTGRATEGHGGGTLLRVGGPEYLDLQAFIARARGTMRCEDATGSACDGKTAAVSRRLLRRLSRFEYDASLHDLFGVAPTWGRTLPPEDVVFGFDNAASALTVGTLFADKARLAAEALGPKVTTASMFACDVKVPSAIDDTCVRSSIAKLGRRIFRRPLVADEIARYRVLYDLVRHDEQPLAALASVVTAMLQSPGFLYRTELGADGKGDLVDLTPHEIAAELSYFLWGSIPDAELDAAADDGSLARPEVIEAHARRMLASPKSAAALRHFAERWLDLDKLDQAAKDATLFPTWTPDVQAAMHLETTSFVARVVQDGGDVQTLLAAPYSYMSDDLAKFYGISPSSGLADASGLKKTDLGAARLGLLTQGSLLAGQAKPTTTAPIQRGKLVREKLFCQPLPPPPPGLAVQLPVVDPKTSNRQRFAQHATDRKCSFCHQLMDPIGFAFEGFDAVGRVQSVDHGVSIDTHGQIVSTPRTDGTFDGVAELAKKLAASEDVQDCIALEWTRFATGLAVEANAQCVIEAAQAHFREKKLDLRELLVGLTLGEHFRRRRADDLSALPPGPTPTFPTTDDAGPPAETPTLDVSIVPDVYVGGYCDRVTVTNLSTTTQTWSARVPVKGTITSFYSSTYTVDAASWVFVGVDFNKTLAPGGEATFGFCAKT